MELNERLTQTEKAAQNFLERRQPIQKEDIEAYCLLQSMYIGEVDVPPDVLAELTDDPFIPDPDVTPEQMAQLELWMTSEIEEYLKAHPHVTAYPPRVLHPAQAII